MAEWEIRKPRVPFYHFRKSRVSSLHVRMASIVEHGNRPFSLEVMISRPEWFSGGPIVHKIKIIPETESDLEAVDLDQRIYMVDPLLRVQDNLGMDDEVGLEYDGNHFTMRLSGKS